MAVMIPFGSWPLVMSTTKTRNDTPTCGAASPMPGAAYMVSIMSSISCCSASSMRSTGCALRRNTPSG